MQTNSESSDNSVLVLLAPGFAEGQVVHYTSSLRKNQVPVSIVGLSRQHVSGMNGLAFQPDYSLNQLPSDKNPLLVLIAGGYQYLASLMADPRVHTLLGNTLKKGYVAADETAESLIPFTNAQAILKGSHFITPNKRSSDEFIQYLTNLVKEKLLPT